MPKALDVGAAEQGRHALEVRDRHDDQRVQQHRAEPEQQVLARLQGQAPAPGLYKRWRLILQFGEGVIAGLTGYFDGGRCRKT
jgi:hypothetical protein